MNAIALATPRSAPARRAPAALRTDHLALLLLVLGIAPLLLPGVPPLVDLPNHMSRYRIGLDYATSPYFHRWFDFHWVLVGNLGVDLLVTLLAPVLGLEPATKFAVLLSPLTTIGGIVLIAREVHGRVPATAAVAAVFAYNWAFNFGFVNFTLAAGLALLAFGVWLRLGRLERRALRRMLFVPIGGLVWLAHAAGWGLLGVLILSWEVAEARAHRLPWVAALGRAVLEVLPLTLPLLPMLAWSARVPTHSLGLFMPDPLRKFAILLLGLRNGLPVAEVGAMLFVLWLCIVGALSPAIRYDRRLLAVALVLVALYIAMPAELLGSGHADLRIGPYAVLMFPLAMRPRAGGELPRPMIVLALLFFVGEMGLLSWRYAAIARAQEHQLEALAHLPIGSSVFALSRVTCATDMAGNRLEHVHRLAIVRRQAFTNGTWPYPASQTLIVKPRMVAGYPDESSQLMPNPDCRDSWRHSVPGALRTIPRDRFRYFWLLDVPQRQWPSRSWLRPVWHNDRTILYAVAPPGRRFAAGGTPARRLPIG